MCVFSTKKKSSNLFMYLLSEKFHLFEKQQNSSKGKETLLGILERQEDELGVQCPQLCLQTMRLKAFSS